MSTIRKQSIISSIIVYIGFALGFLNTYLLTREGGFTEEQYGIICIFAAVANVVLAFANMGMTAYIHKFFPYYQSNLSPSKNDMMSWALLTSFSAFILVMLSGFVFKDFVIRKYGTNAPGLIKYYYWIFPFGFGLTMYTLLEAFALQFRKAVLTSFLRELLFRLLTTVLIALSYVGILKDFDLFIKLYALTYLVIAVILLGYLLYTHKMHLPLSVSRVTRRFYKKIVTLIGFIWGGGLVFNIASVFDSLVIAAVIPNGLLYAAIYTLAQNIASLIQAPQRGIIASSIGPLSQAWHDKDYARINRIYHSSSINQLIFSAGMFVLIWMNFTDAVTTFHMKPTYLQARHVFLFIGLMRIIDMGTGVNSQIIGTSTLWRFDFVTGIILLSVTLPLNYILTKTIGVAGPAISNLITFSIYNGIRYGFLLKKFRMQPFTAKSLYTLLLAAAGYVICHFLFRHFHGFTGMVLRSITFITLYISIVLYMKLSDDMAAVWKTLLKKLQLNLKVK